MRRTYLHKGVAVALALTVALGLGACGKKDTKEQDAYRQYGINCLQIGKYDEAIQAFQNALDQSLGKVGEKEIDICFYKAEAQSLNGATDDALETYNAIIDYNKDGRAYYLRGNLYFDMGDQEKALADYESAVKEDKKDYEIYIGIYQSMNQHGMGQDGQKYLNAALEIKGDKAEDLLYKGRISYLLGDYKTAQTDLEKAKEGGQAKASYYLAQTYKANGDTDKADKCVKEYLDSGAATSYELYDLGTEEMGEGNYTDALTYFNAGLALEKVPNKQNLMKSAIAAYEYSGDFASAKTMLADYLEQYPSDEDAQKESTFLETR